jgi:hypothetical protein
MEHCWINQNSKLSLGLFDAGNKIDYSFNSINKCLFVFAIKGNINISGIDLSQRDAIGIWNTDKIEIGCTDDCEFLIIETPINQK